MFRSLTACRHCPRPQRNGAPQRNISPPPARHGSPSVFVAVTALLLTQLAATIARRPVQLTEAEAVGLGLTRDPDSGRWDSAVQPPLGLATDVVRGREIEVDGHLFAAPYVEPQLTEAHLVSFFAAGIPAPQGSKRAFRNKYSGRIAMVESSARLPGWRSDVRDAGIRVMGDASLLDGPLAVSMSFTFARPKSHFGTGRNALVLKPSAPEWVSSAPDVSKLARAVEDALNGVVWSDDARIALYDRLEKRFGERPGVHVTVRRLT